MFCSWYVALPRIGGEWDMWSCFFLIASINLKIKYNTCGDNEQCPRCPRSKVQRKKYKEGAKQTQD